MPVNPYAEAAPAYWAGGWRGLLPLPHGKKTWPPAGYTGRDGADPSWPDCQAWCEDGPRNICLRLPPGVVGIDVDAYGGKPGAATLTSLVERFGALPATWLSTSRDDGISGIRLYRVPPGVELVGSLPGVEIVQHHHRYIVCQPSTHPSGRMYEWVDEVTGEVGALPPVDGVPALPRAWVEGLASHADGHKKDGGADIVAIWKQLPAGLPCAHITAAAGQVFDGGARHDAYLKAVLGVLGHARRGCPGAHTTIIRLRSAFLAEIVGAGDGQRNQGEAEAEWRRELEGALRIIAAEPQGGTCIGDLAEWAVPSSDDEAEEEARSPAEIEYARKVAVKATEYRISEDAKTILAEHRAGEQPAPQAIRLDIFLGQDDEPVPWRVQDLWGAGGRVLLAAAAKAGKTTLVGRNLLPCLADGGTFLGKFQVEPAAGTIVYLNLEVGADTMRRWLRTTGITAAGRVHVANLRGQAGRLGIGNPAGRGRLADWLRGLGASVVILDPLAPLLAALGLDEDNNGQVAAFFNMWNEAMQLAGVADDLICHHIGHDGERSRGASRLLDEPDAVWTITRPKPPGGDQDDDEEGQERLSEHRFLSATGRDVDLAKSGLQFDHATGRLTLVEGSPSQVRKRMADAGYERRVLAAINDAGAPGLSMRQVIKSGGMESKMREALIRLVSRGAVMEEELGAGQGSRYWTLFPNNHGE